MSGPEWHWTRRDALIALTGDRVTGAGVSGPYLWLRQLFGRFGTVMPREVAIRELSLSLRNPDQLRNVTALACLRSVVSGDDAYRVAVAEAMRRA